MKKTLLLIAVLTTSLLAAQNTPIYLPTDSLIAWFPFSGNSNDESGNGNHGTVFTNSTITGATLTQDRYGNASSAYQFNGTTDYISGTLSGFSNTSISTVSAWLYYSGDAGGKPYDLYFQYGSYGSHTFAYAYNFSNNKFDLFSRCFTNPYSSINLDTAWHHVVVVDSLSITKLYVDGSLFTSFSSGGNSNCYYNSNYFLIGGGADGQYVTGKVDDVGVWKRALSASEVNNLYTAIVCSDSIITHPLSSNNQTIPGTTYFTTAHSDTSATFQWQQNNGAGWTNLSDFGIYSGTTTDSLVLTGITTSLNGYGYRCVIDACTMDTTDVAFLTVVDNVGIEESAKLLTVSPNPTSGLIYVDIKANYSVYNMTGQKVAEGKTEGQIDLSNLPTGSFQLILITEEGTTTHTIQKF